MTTGYVTYYWQAPDRVSIDNAIYQMLDDGDGNLIPTPRFDTLGVAEGNGTYGQVGMFYTCIRATDIMETPQGCALADPFIISNLLGVWA